ncbi:bifunctional enzyme IspD/IspF [Kordiimonas sediminis]|uniref:Bifunctional enzyme IspD/IspF n=1 Tax=Kordiimonas sediminis TaxID=1735581 RepID=A0A919AXJ7_9PROT|nr:bifunctional 2-C-methyl-D-erythritol 4-phosphate cytidylyltransferase/2-C-methyl-D-erythritol 2,4-cyclodiphosphate synthase [Kordiimonas sediminis]GHF28254.1 bifunctional enzyme IspD/IspF [Kordiimonas sediminis]
MPEKKMESQSKIPQNTIIVVAAGRGSRAGAGIPKQYRHIAGKALIRHTLEAIEKTGHFQQIICVIHPDDQTLFDQSTKGMPPYSCVFGGNTRQESVKNGLELTDINSEYIFIHDAARPFIPSTLTSNILQTLLKGVSGVIPAVKITDTLKSVEEGTIQQTIDRTHLYAVQTPQAFPATLLKEAHQSAPHMDFTDDAAVMEAAGHVMHICEGSQNNYKITTQDDFKKAERDMMTSLNDIRIGSGYDVHRFEAGTMVTLCGVKVPHTHALKGHSDADVALHALTDALLSSIADGDIGSHFPPIEPRWKGEPSITFLLHAKELIAQQSGCIAHVAITIICESPKIGPYREQMQTFIAEALEIPVNRVSIQATTTEKLGFTGRKEGIAASATVTVRLP